MQCSYALSGKEWMDFTDGIHAMNGSGMMVCSFFLLGVSFSADRLDDGIDLLLIVPHNIYGQGTRHITTLNVRDALYMIEECAADERLIRVCSTQV